MALSICSELLCHQISEAGWVSSALCGLWPDEVLGLERPDASCALPHCCFITRVRGSARRERGPEADQPTV